MPGAVNRLEVGKKVLGVALVVPPHGVPHSLGVFAIDCCKELVLEGIGCGLVSFPDGKGHVIFFVDMVHGFVCCCLEVMGDNGRLFGDGKWGPTRGVGVVLLFG